MWQSHIAPPILALLLAVALVLTGCGQGPDSEPGTAAPTVDTVAETASNPTMTPAAPGSVATAPAPTKEARPSSTTEPALVRAPDSTATRLPAASPDPTATTRPADPSPTETPIAVGPSPPPSPEPLPTETPIAVGPSPPPSPAPSPTETPIVVDGESGGGVQGAVAVTLREAVEIPTTEIVKILTPSVVDITTEFVGASAFNSAAPPSGIGTGVVLDLEGHILTSNHVIEGAERIDVTMHNGTSYPAEVAGFDPPTDLAVIKITAEGLEPAALGKSSELLVGEDVIAIGHALGLSGAPTVSKGVVSALGRSIDTDRNVTVIGLIQTDASINPGNSGGPLVNNRAEVVGISTAMFRAGQGIGFAINIDDAKVVARQLIDQGFVTRGYLGVLIARLTPALAVRMGLDADTEGVVLRAVLPGAPADDAGLLQGDIIRMMGGQTLRNTGELSKFLIAHRPGDTVDFLVIRDGEEVTGQLTLGSRPEG